MESNINACWSFGNVIQNRIINEILKFPCNTDAIIIDEDPFALVAIINTADVDLRALIDSGKSKKVKKKLSLDLEISKV